MVVIVAAVALLSTLQTSSACLHDRATESPEQVSRRHAALTLARAVNTAESRYSARNDRTFADVPALIASAVLPANGTDAVPGFSLRLDLTEKGYWFEIVDQQDSCGFRYISNQNGLILEAQPIQ